MKLSEELAWRGFINQTTLSDLAVLDQEPRKFYLGVDPSAVSMTIGNLAILLMVKHLINHGHEAYLLVGGATGMIGDPDGKKQERDLRQESTVQENSLGIKSQMERIFDGAPINMVNNHDWFKDINYIDFLHRVGKHVSMTQLLDRDFVQQRVGEGGSGISYGEFSYGLIQGYDFYHLNKEHGITLQLAGADQWGNGLIGVSLARKLGGAEVHVLTAPLVVNKSTGVKFGKSEAGAIWLDEDMTSPFSFYQFWMNLDDLGVEDYIKIYTFLSREEIEGVLAKHRENPSMRIAQKRLALEVTEIVHGVDKARRAQQVSEILFAGQALDVTDQELVEDLARELPVGQIGQLVSDALVDAKVASSKSEVRRLVSGGGVAVNGEKIADDVVITEVSLIKKGKNNFVLVR